MHPDDWLTDAEILSTLTHEGFAGYAERRLERWRKAGILPKRRQRGRGKGVGRGPALSPPGSDRQALAIASSLRRSRKFNAVVLDLFASGYAVDPRTSIAASLPEVEVPRHARKQPSADDDDQIFEQAERLARRAEHGVRREATERTLILQMGGPMDDESAEDALKALELDELVPNSMRKLGVGQGPSDGRVTANDIASASKRLTTRTLADVVLGAQLDTVFQLRDAALEKTDQFHEIMAFVLAGLLSPASIEARTTSSSVRPSL